jgi:hypothetical protein
MALDDVVIRAMSKDADDRYPSAGDLGRAAQAALSGTQVALPERTVATGAAATRESEPPTQRIPEELESSSNRRGFLLGAGALALVAAIVLAIALTSGGGGDGASGETTGAQTVKKTKPEKPMPATLSAATLVAKGDEICTDSQETYKAYRGEFPSGESETSVGYSQLLVGISGKAMRRFEELKPPPALKQDYDAYVKSQKQVAQWDEDALKAAEKEDLSAYMAAREKRDATEAERKALAEAVGFHVCSGSEA